MPFSDLSFYLEEKTEMCLIVIEEVTQTTVNGFSTLDLSMTSIHWSGMYNVSTLRFFTYIEAKSQSHGKKL